jgi:hypothetical protein
MLALLKPCLRTERSQSESKMNAVAFVTRYPEMAAMNQQNPGFIAAVLAEADRSVASNVTDREDLIALVAAEKIATSPQGRAAQMSGKGESSYTRALREECSARAIGARFF